MQYVKIKDVIVEQIEAGQLISGQKLPGERKLAETFDTTRITLREALSLLEAEGRIYREDRRGWFVSPLPLRYDPSQILNFPSVAKEQGRWPRTQVLGAKVVLANKQAAKLLGLEPFAEVYQIERVRYLDDRPVVYVTNFLRVEAFPDLLSLDLSNSLSDLYCERFDVTLHSTRYQISIGTLLGKTAQALRATSGMPTMMVERTNFDQQGAPVDCEIEYWRHDAVRIESAAQFA